MSCTYAYIVLHTHIHCCTYRHTLYEHFGVFWNEQALSPIFDYTAIPYFINKTIYDHAMYLLQYNLTQLRIIHVHMYILIQHNVIKYHKYELLNKMNWILYVTQSMKTWQNGVFLKIHISVLHHGVSCT